MRGNTKQVALCGIFSALSIVLMFMGTIIEVFDLTAAAASSFLVFLITKIYGSKWGFSLYFTISLLAFVFLGIKFVCIVFAFVGYYPIIKVLFEDRIRNKKMMWILKLLVFNVGFTLILFFGRKFLFNLDLNDKIIYEIIIAYPLGNIFIVLYDIACQKIINKNYSLLFKLLR